jgi:hypothetical protein
VNCGERSARRIFESIHLGGAVIRCGKVRLSWKAGPSSEDPKPRYWASARWQPLSYLYALQSSLSISFQVLRHLRTTEYSDELRFTQLRCLVSLTLEDKKADVPARHCRQITLTATSFLRIVSRSTYSLRYVCCHDVKYISCGSSGIAPARWTSHEAPRHPDG